MIGKKAREYNPAVGDRVRFPTNLHHDRNWDLGQVVKVYTPTNIVIKVGDTEILMRNNDVEFLRSDKKPSSERKPSKFRIWKDKLASLVKIPDVVSNDMLRRWYKKDIDIDIIVDVLSGK